MFQHNFHRDTLNSLCFLLFPEKWFETLVPGPILTDGKVGELQPITIRNLDKRHKDFIVLAAYLHYNKLDYYIYGFPKSFLAI